MKRILISALLIFPLCVFAEDSSGINGANIPQWKDFAPSAFVDVKEPTKLGKLNPTTVYWYQRKVDFEAGLEECSSLDAGDQFSCYENLKVKQFKENTDYNARIEAQQRARAGGQEMNSMTDTMLPINNYLNNFTRFQPNEIR